MKMVYDAGAMDAKKKWLKHYNVYTFFRKIDLASQTSFTTVRTIDYEFVEYTAVTDFNSSLSSLLR
jgi:hypothetical protein